MCIRDSENIIVWQWCRGVRERQGDVLKLDDEWWCPYLSNENMKIEDAFIKNMNSIDIDLPGCGMRRFIFKRGSCFATQNDVMNKKTRIVRRITTTIKELKLMLDKMSSPPLDISQIIENLPEGAVPNHFYCCISQDIMNEPVKTVDGHTYDKVSIERWFQHNNTSPLTGLHLSSTVLEPNLILQQQIKEFIDSKVSSLAGSSSE